MQIGETEKLTEMKQTTISGEILARLGDKIESLVRIRERIEAINQKLTGGEFLSDKPTEKTIDPRTNKSQSFLVEVTLKIDQIAYVEKEIGDFLGSLERVF